MPVNNLEGQRFGRLVVQAQEASKAEHAYWLCLCDCGEPAVVRGTKLVEGRQVSCGCARADASVRRAARMVTPPKRRVAIAKLARAARDAPTPRS